MAVAPAVATRRAPALHVLMALVAGGGAAVIAYRIGTLWSAPVTTLGAVAGIALLVVLCDQFTLDLPAGGEVERFGFTDAVWVAAIVLAPEGAPTLGAAAGALIWQAIRGVPPAKLGFNVGQVALALTAAELIWRIPGTPPEATEPAAWALAALAGAAAFAINETTVAGAIALSRRMPFRGVLLPTLSASALQWLAAVSIGLLAALAWTASPIGLVLIVPPLVLVFVAHREFLAGLVEREQMQDLAMTAERIARDRDPAGRLPVVAETGRLTELTASLNRMLEQMEEASGREHNLMRATADRLQTPMRWIRASLENEGPLEEAERRDVLEHVRHVTDVLEGMERVVVAGRPGIVQPVPVPVGHFLSRVGAQAPYQLAGRFTVVPPAANAVTRLDPRWMERALLALLDNALVHGRPGARVEMRALPVDGGWRFEVSDEGGGVPVGHEAAVFEPFYRTSEVCGRPGLGLALVRGVADAHGGSAGIANRPGSGATFWLHVPSWG